MQRFMIRSFLVKKELSTAFRKFMEEKHVKTILKTGCFEHRLRKCFNENVKPGFDSIVYVLETDNSRWDHYQKVYQAKTAEEFMEENKDHLQSGDISVIKTDGLLEDIAY